MKSIQGRPQAKSQRLIDREFNGVQTRMAENLELRQILVNRWALGKKVIGDCGCAKIEAAANKPVTGLISIARFLRKVFSLSARNDIGQLAAGNWNAG